MDLSEVFRFDTILFVDLFIMLATVILLRVK